MGVTITDWIFCHIFGNSGVIELYSSRKYLIVFILQNAIYVCKVLFYIHSKSMKTYVNSFGNSEANHACGLTSFKNYHVRINIHSPFIHWIKRMLKIFLPFSITWHLWENCTGRNGMYWRVSFTDEFEDAKEEQYYQDTLQCIIKTNAKFVT